MKHPIIKLHFLHVLGIFLLCCVGCDFPGIQEVTSNNGEVQERFEPEAHPPSAENWPSALGGERWYTGNGIVGSAPEAHPPPAENPPSLQRLEGDVLRVCLVEREIV